MFQNEATPAGQGDTATAATQNAAGNWHAEDTDASQPHAWNTTTPEPRQDGSDRQEQSGFDALLSEDEATPETNQDTQAAPNEDWQIALPEGWTLDQEAAAEIQGVVKDGLVPKDKAQKLVDAHIASLRRYEASKREAAVRTMADWQERIRADPEVGGARLDESVKICKAALKKYGSPELMRDFAEMGALGHPEFFRFVTRIAPMALESRSAGGTHEAEPQRSRADILFPAR